MQARIYAAVTCIQTADAAEGSASNTAPQVPPEITDAADIRDVRKLLALAFPPPPLPPPSTLSSTGGDNGARIRTSTDGGPKKWDQVLPAGWERAVDVDGMSYFVNHFTKQTTWLHPTTNRPVGKIVLAPRQSHKLCISCSVMHNYTQCWVQLECVVSADCSRGLCKQRVAWSLQSAAAVSTSNACKGQERAPWRVEQRARLHVGGFMRCFCY